MFIPATQLCLLFCLISATLFGQRGFVASRQRVMAASAEQWYCKALEASSPEIFSKADFSAPQWPQSPWLTGLPEPSSSVLRSFIRVYQPDGTMHHSLAIKSLSDLYFPLFERKLKGQTLPVEYKFLPLIFSGFNPHYTDERDRAGLWALDYLVARRQGLRTDSLIDERRGADFTTDAAVKYLAFLHNRFQGNAPEVILAWWYSPAYVEHRLSLCEEFIPCLDDEALSILQFVEFSIAYFNALSAANRLTAYFDVLGQSGQVFFTRTARYAALHDVLGSDPGLLHQMNPVYVGEQIPGDFRRVSFSMPLQQVELFRQKEDSIYSWTPRIPVNPVLPETEEKTTHRVRRGETLGGIAAKYHVSVSQLKKWNHLRSDRIHEGQKLVIQRKVPVARQPVTEQAPDIRPEATDSLTPAPSPASDQPPRNDPPPKPTHSTVTYRVKSGDSLWKIASRYPGVTAEDIMKWNKCGPDIRPGQKLKIHR